MKQLFDLELGHARVTILLSEVAAIFVADLQPHEALVILKSGDRFVPINVDEAERIKLAWQRYVGDIAPEHQAEHIGIVKMVREATGAGPRQVLETLKRHDWRIDAVMHELRNAGLA